MHLVEGSIYSIQCSYIAERNIVSGCSYVLVSVVQDTRDIHGTIDESSTVNLLHAITMKIIAGFLSMMRSRYWS